MLRLILGSVEGPGTYVYCIYGVKESNRGWGCSDLRFLTFMITVFVGVKEGNQGCNCSEKVLRYMAFIFTAFMVPGKVARDAFVLRKC